MHIQITYVCKQKPEAEFVKNDPKYEFKNIFGMHKPASLNKGIMKVLSYAFGVHVDIGH
jgi:hypothetical protein